MIGIGAEVVDRLGSAELTRDPWDHAYLPSALPADAALRLSQSFDHLELRECEEREREKTYRFATADLDADHAAVAPDWAALVDALRGPEYRAAMTRLTGVALEDASLGLAVWEYRHGDWLAPHVDKPDKVVTQIFYFTESWTERDRGRLLVLDGPAVSEPRRLVAPVLGSSAVLVRSDSSWHAVEPLAANASGLRRSLTATFRR